MFAKIIPHGHLTDAYAFSRTNVDFPTDISRTLADFRGQYSISPRTPHGRSRTFTDNFRSPHGHLTDAHGLSRTIFDFPTDTSLTCTDFHGPFSISSRISHGCSRSLTDNFLFPLGDLTDTLQTLTDFYGQFLIISWTPHGRSRTLTDNF